MKHFEKIKKKYALNNSYFKNYLPTHPSTPYEVLDYYLQHNELPYTDNVSENWFYDCFVEYQKRKGVANNQFFTPPQTAEDMVNTLYMYADKDDSVIDACCGFGQITKHLINYGFENILAFDSDSNLIDAAEKLNKDVDIFTIDDFDTPNRDLQFGKMAITKNVIANPPYDVKQLTSFLYWMNTAMYEYGVAVLLLPKGFLSKTRPANLVKILNNFYIESREDMKESFARTNTRAEIVVLRKNK